MNRRLLPATLILAASCAGGGDSTADSAQRAANAPHIGTVCPGSEAARTAARSGVISNVQADKPAEPVPPMPQFKYPDELAAKGIGGKAIADFVVDTAGLVDMTSIDVRESTDSRITEGVCHYLAASRFSPAIKGGVAVRVQRELPFTFETARK